MSSIYVVADPLPPVAVHLDPSSPEDCAALADALFAETGIEIDPEAIADALRSLPGAR